MINVKINDDMIRLAQMRADKIGILRNSISSGKGNLIGALGEIIVSVYLNIDIYTQREFSYNYDILFRNKKIEVKSKTCNSVPLPEYECSLAEYNTIQDCDYYVFTRIRQNLEEGWILGVISKQEFFNVCKVFPKRTPQSNWLNGETFRCNTFNIPINRLKPFSILHN